MFTTLTPASVSRWFPIRVRQDSRGTLWAATSAGVGVVRGDSLLPVAPETIRGIVADIAERRDGSVWAASARGGLFRIADGRATQIVPPGRFDGDSLSALHEDRSGTLWIAGERNIWRWRDSFEHEVQTPGDLAFEMFESRSSRDVYVVSPKRIYRVDIGGASRVYDMASSGRGYWSSVAFADAAGRVHFTDGNTVLRTGQNAPGATTTTEVVASAPALITAATFDHEGSLWLGTQDRGLYRIKPTAVRIVADADGATSNNVYPVLETRDGAVWYGTNTGDIVRVADGKARAVLRGSPWWIRSLLEGGDGRVWAGGTVLYTCSSRPPGCEVAPNAPPPLTRFGLLAMHEDSVGMWLGTERGLYRFDRGEWRQLTAEDGAPTTPVRVFLRTTDGALWMGSGGEGVARLQGGRFRIIGTAEGLPSSIGQAQPLRSPRGW